jgi:multidrug efflux pump subunit AcrA (membrane-fusion protein)
MVNIKGLLGNKWVKISLAIIAIILVVKSCSGGEAEQEYVIAEATRGDIIQTVSATGSIKADPSIDLHFRQGGTVKEILVDEGALVNEGDLLSSLKNEILELEIDRMQANLDYSVAQYNKTKAGAKYEEILIAQADVTSAQAAYNASLTELENTDSISDSSIELAEIAYTKAENAKNAAYQEYLTTKELAEAEIANLEITGESSASIQLDNAYSSARIQLDSLFTTLQDSLFLAEDTIGVRGTGFFLLSQTNKNKLESVYHEPAEQAYEDALAIKQALPADPTDEELNTAIAGILDASSKTLALLSQIGYELEKLPYDRTDLENLILEISSQSTSLSSATLGLQETQNQILILTAGASQNIDTLTLSYQLQIDAAEARYDAAENTLAEAAYSLDQAKLTAEITDDNAEAMAALKKAALDTAIAMLSLKQSPARTVDLAPLSAQINQADIALKIAQQNYKDSQIYAPIDGKVVFIHGDVGQNIGISETTLSSFITINAQQLVVEANVPETDIVKVKEKDAVTMTLDALDFTEKLNGEVITVDQAETIIQGVVYYKIQSVFDIQDDRVKPGMTVNLDIETDKKEDVLMIPIRALKYEDSVKYVEVLNNGTPQRVNLETGIENDQYVEIISGLNEGDKVITFVK